MAEFHKHSAKSLKVQHFLSGVDRLYWLEMPSKVNEKSKNPAGFKMFSGRICYGRLNVDVANQRAGMTPEKLAMAFDKLLRW